MSRTFVGVGLLLVTASVGMCAEPELAPPPRRALIGLQFAKQGRVDLFVAASAVWDFDADDPRMWEPVQHFGRSLIEKAEMKGGRKPHNCPSSFKDFATYQKLTPPRFTRVDELYRPDVWRNESIQAPGITHTTAFHNGIILSRASVEAIHTGTSVVLTNGNVVSPGGISESVIVCDGDVTITRGFISRSLIVARGNITAKQGADRSVLIAGGNVTLGERRDGDEGRQNVIKENAVNPLGITFFELSTVGVEVKPAKDVVQVSAVGKGKVFAKAGVQVGDTILTVEGKKPDSAESLRRLLRDALAIGDATITLRRGEKTVTVKVSLPE